MLLLDELEKINLWYTVILLSLMETGIVTESKHRWRWDERLNKMAATTANRIDSLPPELKSRLMTFHFREYDDETFREVVEAVLTSRELTKPWCST